MKRLRFSGLVAALLSTLAISACHTDEDRPVVETVEISGSHSPIIATDAESVTITAEANTDAERYAIYIIVDGAHEKTCNNTPTCSVTVGPLSSTPPGGGTGNPHSYTVMLDPDEPHCLVDPCRDMHEVTFGVTGSNYEYDGTAAFIPAMSQGGRDQVDVVFHMAGDYNTTTLSPSFIDDVEDKIYDTYGAQHFIEDRMKDFNFWVYTNQAQTSGCGTLHSDASNHLPFADAHAVLHVNTFGDCSNGNTFTAEGHDTKAFLHESGHGVFGMADEYDGNTSYFQSANEPNIWSSDSNCENEQNNKGRDPSDCSQFTSRQNGWYKTHTQQTVMEWGDTGEPWGTEGVERLEWFFNNL